MFSVLGISGPKTSVDDVISGLGGTGGSTARVGWVMKTSRRELFRPSVDDILGGGSGLDLLDSGVSVQLLWI